MILKYGSFYCTITVMKRCCCFGVKFCLVRIYKHAYTNFMKDSFFLFFFCGVELTSPGTAATSGLLYSPR
jgi:hypothetical protein